MGIGVGVAWGMLKWDVWRMGRGQGVDEVELMGDQRSARGFLFFLVHELLGWGCTGMYFEPVLGLWGLVWPVRELSHNHTEGTEALDQHHQTRRLLKIMCGRLESPDDCRGSERMN